VLRRSSSWHVAVVRDEECSIVVGKSEARFHSEDLDLDGRITLKTLKYAHYATIFYYEKVR
jgi:hypothetical protein